MRKSLDKQIAERWLFTGLALLNALPLLIYAYYPGLDAPAHLYNASLLSDILHSHSPLQQYFILNPITTNWTDHIILVLLNTFLPPWLALKALQLVLVLGLAFAFRYLVITMKGSAGMETLLILPFAYTFPFILGFYNFIIGIIFSLLLFAWIEKYKTKGGLLWLAGTGALFLMLWLTHAFVFLCFGLSMLILTLTDILESIRNKIIVVRKLQTYARLFLAALPAIVLCIGFFVLKQHSAIAGTDRYLPKSELFSWLLICRPLVLFDSTSEKIPALAISLLLLFLAGWLIFLSFKNQLGKTFRNFLSAIFNSNNRWLIAAVIFLLALLILPDFRAGQGGHISVRLATFLFPLILLWVCMYSFPAWINRLILIIILGISAGRFMQTRDACREYNNSAKEMAGLSSLIRPYATVRTLNHSDNWLYLHLSNFAGIGSRAIMDNYEADTRIFPLRWKYERKPRLKRSNTGLSYLELNDSLERPVDELLIWNLRKPGVLKEADSLQKSGFRAIAISNGGNALLMENEGNGFAMKPAMKNLTGQDTLALLKPPGVKEYPDSEIHQGQFFDCFKGKMENFDRRDGVVLRAELKIRIMEVMGQGRLYLVASLSDRGEIFQYQASDIGNDTTDSIASVNVLVAAPPSTPGATEIKFYIWNPAGTKYSIQSFSIYRWNIRVTEGRPG